MRYLKTSLTSPPMIASVGASRTRIAVFTVSATSAAFSALAMFALHIGQANDCAAPAVRITAAPNINFAKRPKGISPPVEDQHK
ncbi:MAG: hypothetical protein AB7U82_24620 [Blastocatellales bacterium]